MIDCHMLSLPWQISHACTCTYSMYSIRQYDRNYPIKEVFQSNPIKEVYEVNEK